MKIIAPPDVYAVRFIAIVNSRAPADYRRVPDSPPHHCFVRVDEGVLLGETVAGTQYVAGPGDMLYFRKGVRRDTWNDPERRFAGLVLMFDAAPELRELPARVHDHQGRLRTLTQWLCETTRPRIAGEYEEIGYGLLQAVLAEYVRLGQLPSHPMVVAVRQYAAARLHERLSLAGLAAEVGLSRYHFARRYRELAGISPMADIQTMRLEAARELLLTTDLPLKAIADRVGLADASHLARLFRRHFGVGTRSYRS